jgi:hypothetical protein
MFNASPLMKLIGVLIRGSVTGNILTIEAQDNTCTDTISWMVIGERKDQHMLDTEWTDDEGHVINEPLKPVEPEVVEEEVVEEEVVEKVPEEELEE